MTHKFKFRGLVKTLHLFYLYKVIANIILAITLTPLLNYIQYFHY